MIIMNGCVIHTLIVEFRHFPKVSNLRRIKLCRNKKEEQRDVIGGYCGGIRKLEDHRDIQKWNNLLLQFQRWKLANLIKSSTAPSAMATPAQVDHHLKQHPQHVTTAMPSSRYPPSTTPGATTTIQYTMTSKDLQEIGSTKTNINQLRSKPKT
ncbi:hypothetical protein VIGAN_04215900 [Vigna angularis var. angularis]|uniref:Uncharacterized protein n=1 Tax=Vigna angularis var. angularis TaxID=157739 RepID=A0A0S3RVV1_PHAAN|nr:hypothetical protein VIGAN_04215900 [Vigna angularis var. angularis]